MHLEFGPGISLTDWTGDMPDTATEVGRLSEEISCLRGPQAVLLLSPSTCIVRHEQAIFGNENRQNTLPEQAAFRGGLRRE